ncbi:ANTAR domain-containing protein [Aeromicrobium sp. SMF47]|nr:ANTAR domain-containing protein [Aeromicrobium yanjiei]MRK00887.1 ANTAR domain-containing protein [Aeromicrobium sp. S22]
MALLLRGGGRPGGPLTAIYPRLPIRTIRVAQMPATCQNRGMSNDASGDKFSDIARALSNEPGVTATLENATATAVAIIDGCDYAGISLVTKRGGIQTVAPTHDIAARADQLQQEAGEGPDLQSISEQETIYAEDLLSEDRWPQWAKRAADELGVRSVLALQLFVGSQSLGSLNLYSRAPGAFPVDQRATAMALSAHVAVAVAASTQQDDLESALLSRTVIGQAEGMLMQLLGITGDQAFAALVRVSQTRNIKLHLIAAEIVEHGVRPDLFS